MASHFRVALLSEEGVFFADAGSPWMRGTNENTNGLVRQYCPRACTSLPSAPSTFRPSRTSSTTDRGSGWDGRHPPRSGPGHTDVVTVATVARIRPCIPVPPEGQFPRAADTVIPAWHVRAPAFVSAPLQRCASRGKIPVDNLMAAPQRCHPADLPAGGAHPRAAQAPGALPLPVGRAPAGGLRGGSLGGRHR